jgi:hypothetical protein
MHWLHKHLPDIYFLCLFSFVGAGLITGRPIFYELALQCGPGSVFLFFSMVTWSLLHAPPRDFKVRGGKWYAVLMMLVILCVMACLMWTMWGSVTRYFEVMSRPRRASLNTFTEASRDYLTSLHSCSTGPESPRAVPGRLRKRSVSSQISVTPSSRRGRDPNCDLMCAAEIAWPTLNVWRTGHCGGRVEVLSLDYQQYLAAHRAHDSHFPGSSHTG